jgi:Rho GDP-dissociation inhibitor
LIFILIDLKEEIFFFKEPTDPNKLILKKLSMIPDDHAEITFDLTTNLDNYKEKVVTLKEGSSYKIKLEFYVQRDIVSGLRLVQHTYKGPIRSKKSFFSLTFLCTIYNIQS